MSDETTAWMPGYQQPPQAAAPAPAVHPTNVATSNLANVGGLMKQAVPAPARGYHRFELPESFTSSMYWKGSHADLFFGMWEPNSGEVKKLTRSQPVWSDAAQSFVCALGVLNPETGKVARDEQGEPVMHEDPRAVSGWWHRIPPKAQSAITAMFMEFIMPSEKEGESLRASRKWVAGA